ncbi:MAG TPA: esterase [Casimicrobiaceae bacterium]|jgi:phospholipase/carboxylesterase|nr:esterase [Casimicrobiaceae bacterium]
MDLDAVLHLLPRAGTPTPLYIHLHGVGATALAMTPVADRFAQAWPQAAHLMPDGFAPTDLATQGRQWFSVLDITEENRPERVRSVLPKLAEFVADAQRTMGVSAPATALVGFSQGAIVALEFAQAYPALVGRVVAIAGRYATLPDVAPSAVVHLVHGKEDRVVPARHSVDAAQRIIALGGDVTADVVPGVGHEPHPALVDAAIGHLQTFLPRRVWAAAIAEAPLMSTRADSRDLAPPAPPPAANDPR